MGSQTRHIAQPWLAWKAQASFQQQIAATAALAATNEWRAHPFLVQGDLLCEALFGKVPHSIVVSIRQEVRQLVLSLGILLRYHTLVECTQEANKTRDMASPCDGCHCGQLIVSMVRCVCASWLSDDVTLTI